MFRFDQWRAEEGDEDCWVEAVPAAGGEAGGGHQGGAAGQAAGGQGDTEQGGKR